MELQKESDLKATLERRRATLRESLRLKPVHPPATSAVNDSGSPVGEYVDGPPTTGTTNFSTTDQSALLERLKARRLKRKDQLPPLGDTTSSPPPPTLDSTDGNTNTSDGSTGLGSTLRERLRNRVQRSQVERSTQRGLPPSPEAPPTHKLHRLRDQQKVTRFDSPATDGLQSERQGEEEQPVRTKSLTQVTSSRWKLLSGKISEVVKKTTDQEGYDFFTSAIEDDFSSFERRPLPPPTGTRHPLPPATTTDGADQDIQPAEPVEGDAEEQQQEEMDTSALLEQTDDGNEGGVPTITQPEVGDTEKELLIEMSHPRYTSHQKRQEMESDLYFTPTAIPVPIEQKTPGSKPPHYLEDEGLYVGVRPRINWANQVVIENRFLKRRDKGEGWFGEDGLLLAQPDPLSKINTRPQVLHYDGTDHIHFKHARIEAYNQKLINIGSDDGTYQLEIDLSSLHFTHHSLFSPEHVLASRLQQGCRQFSNIIRNKTAEYYYEKLQALRRAVLDLKHVLQDMESQDSSSSDAQVTLSHLIGYSRELRAVRQQWKNEMESNYNLLKRILRTWQELKALRDNQGYSSTTASLTIKRIPTNEMEEETQMRREIEDELSEVRDEFERGLTERMAVYETELADWKVYDKSRRKAVRRASRLQQQQQQQQQQQSDLEPGTEQSAPEGSQTSLSQFNELMASIPPERPRPNPPPLFNEAQVRQELFDYYRTNHRLPGAPLLIPELRHTHAISQQCPHAEQQRREEVARMRISVKVLFNDQEVSHTQKCSLNSDFTVPIGETFTIRIVQWPESIKLQVIEHGLLTSNLLSEVYVPIPDPQQTSESGVEPEPYQFSSNKTVAYTHTAVGSGEPHPALPEAGILVTSGSLHVGVCWSVDNKGRALCPPGFRQPMAFNSSRTDAITSLGMAGIADLQEVKKWIEQSRMDPNDPRNAELLQLVESIPSSTEQDQFFRLIDLDDVQRFIDDEKFESERRWNMLQLRDQGHPGLKNKSVPLQSESISKSMWTSVEKYKPYADYDLPQYFFGDFHSDRKEEQNRFLLDVRERVLSRVRSGKCDLTLEDVVHSDIIPNIGALKSTLVEFVSPRRPLKPVRRTRRKPKPQNVHVTDASIVVRVVRAFNVPTRTHQNTGRAGAFNARPFSATYHDRPSVSLPVTGPEGTAVSGGLFFSSTGQSNTTRLGGGHEDDRDTGFRQEDMVRPYVEISFGETSLRTSTACNPNPFWNEELSLPFVPPNDDFSPTSLQKVSDVLHINLFDELVVDILQDDRQRATNIHQRIEKKWLGSFTLPFSTLHKRERVEGTFRLDVPLLLLGYNSRYQQPPTAFTITDDPLLNMASSGHTHLQLFVALEPPLSVLPPIKDRFDSREDVHLRRQATAWLKKLREDFPMRNYTATGLDISGQHVFVTRFVKAQNPPPEFIPLQDTNRTVNTMERLARYVSLIPFLPDAIAFSGACDIWTTSDQFLHMLAGDEEEHAILLCNYFLYCGWKAWVLLGHAIPEGETAYVLTENPQSGVGYWLWNPSTGTHYAQHEPYTPLVSVGCVFNDQNVWANIQEYDDPSRLVFDLSSTKHWRPLFPSDSDPLATVQQELHYSETDNSKVHELQEKIERSVRERMINLRGRFVTRWNRHCVRKLQSLLPKLEEQLTSPPLHEHYSELNEITSSYKLTGFPIHFGYSEIQHIVSRVERTGIHLCEDQKVEYALAVHIHPYPNDVLSVWLYMAALIPK